MCNPSIIVYVNKSNITAIYTTYWQCIAIRKPVNVLLDWNSFKKITLNYSTLSKTKHFSNSEAIFGNTKIISG